MAVTLGTLVTQILNEANRDSATYATMVQNSILTAIKYMEAEHPYVFEKVGTITIPATNNAISLPPDLSKLVYAYWTSSTVTNVIYGERQGFTPISYQDLISLNNNTSSMGNPMHYALFANSFWVYPNVASDTTFTLSYYYKDSSYPQISTDTSIWFGDFTVDCIRAKATEDFYRYALQTPDLADRFMQSFKDYVQNLSTRTSGRQVNYKLSI